MELKFCVYKGDLLLCAMHRKQEPPFLQSVGFQKEFGKIL